MTLDELEKVVMEYKDKIDTILNTVDESEKKYKHDKGLEEFTERNGEALGKYSDKLKKLNGDDFDIFSSAFDEYTNDFSDIEEATYVAQLVSEIDSKIAKLKEALGDEEVEVKSDEDTTKVETETAEVETPAEEPKKEETETEEKEEEEKPEEDDAEADFVKELEEDYDKFHR